MAYLLDANVFIAAKNSHYGLDFCPAFWDWIVLKNSQGDLFSIEKVRNELRDVEDDLSDWIRNLENNFFLKPRDNIQATFMEINRWMNCCERYEQTAIINFSRDRNADCYLIAQAKEGNHIVVTHEVSSNSPKKIKIPDVCAGINVQCVTPYTMLRTEGARFIL